MSGSARLIIVDDDLGLARLLKLMEKGARGESYVEVGVLDSSGLGWLAGIHEFGAPGADIPERSFIRSTIDANESEYLRDMERGFQRLIDDTVKLRPLLSQLGDKVKVDMVDTIASMTSPPLAESTVDRKGSSSLLIDTGALIGSIDSEVKV